MIVREHIFEKFVEDSDPIHDMGIGISAQIADFMESLDNEENTLDNALAECSYHGKTDFVRWLLKAGADIHYAQNWALRFASDKGHIEVVKLLLQAGANVHADDDNALRWASYNGHAEVVKVLLDAGANVNAEDGEALFVAKEQGHTEVIKILKNHMQYVK